MVTQCKLVLVSCFALLASCVAVEIAAPRSTFISWDGLAHTACGAARMCTPRTPWPPQPAPGPSKYTQRSKDLYLDGVTSRRIEGAMNPHQPNVTAQLSAYQHSLGLHGAVGEIGVHMGLYFLSLAVHAAANEPLVAADLFPGVASGTVDGSGYAQLDKFKSNIKSVGIDPESVTILSGDSRLLNSDSFTSKGLPKFRLLSVDGGHTQDIAMSDMQVAGCVVMPGGVAVVDDITNMEWIGVIQAVSLFVQCPGSQLAPFLIFQNKLFMTTVSFHELYLRWARTTFNCRTDWHISRRSMGPWEMCWPM